MALVKNTTGSDTAMTIRHFRRNTDIKAWIDDQNIYSSIIAKYYLELSNKAIGNMTGAQPDIFSFHKGDTIVIKAEFAGGGPFFGAYISPSDNNLILLEDDEIKWVINSTTVASVPYTEGIHTYGWIGVDDNGTRKSQPFYDGSVVSGSSPQAFDDRTIVYIGGVNMGQGVSPACVTGTDNAIRIYEVAASTSEGRWHLYPCTCVLNGTTYHTMFDSENRTPNRVKTTLVGNSSGTHEATGDFPLITGSTYVDGFGIQLDDVKRIANSSYIDLMGISMEDNGYPASGADPADHISKTGESHDFAFRLANGTGSTVSSPIPVPTGYAVTRDSQGNIRQYIKGDLIMGRSPKWNLWNDNIKFGKYTRTQTQGGVSGRFYCWNILKDDKGDNMTDLLGRWDGYDSAANHAPSFNAASTVNAEFHNTIACICTDDNKIVGPNNTECQTIYKYNKQSIFEGKFNIGNLAPWNMTTTELTNSTLIFYGAGIRLDFVGPTIAVNLANAEFMNTEGSFFSASSNADKTLFRDGNLFSDTMEFNERLLTTLYKWCKDYANNYSTMPCKANLYLIGDNDSQVSTENILVPKSVNIVPTFDENHKTTYTSGEHYHNKDRFIIGEQGGKCILSGDELDINVMSDTKTRTLWQDFLIEYEYTDALKELGRGIGCAVALWNGSNVVNIEDKLVAFIETTLVKDDGTFYGRYSAFTDPVSLIGPYSSTQKPYYQMPFNTDDGPTPQFGLDGTQSGRPVWPRGWYVYPTDFTTTRACMWRWKDLYHTTSDTSADNERPKESGTAIPMTSHMRLFENTTNNKGPVAWSLYYSQDDNHGWSSDYGVPFRKVKYNNVSYKLAPIVTDPIVKYNSVQKEGVYYTKVVDCWLGIYNNTTGARITDMATLPSGFGVTLSETVLHAPHERLNSQTSTGGDIVPVDVASITLNDTNFHTSGNYGMQVSAKEYYRESFVGYDGNASSNEDGFYHLECWIKTANYKPGAYYQIEFLTEQIS